VNLHNFFRALGAGSQSYEIFTNILPLLAFKRRFFLKYGGSSLYNALQAFCRNLPDCLIGQVLIFYGTFALSPFAAV